MTDTADHTANQTVPAGRDTSPRPPRSSWPTPSRCPHPAPPRPASASPPTPSSWTAPTPLTDPDDDVDGEDEPGGEDDDSDGADGSDDPDAATRLDADGFPILDEDSDADENTGTADTADSTRVEIAVPDFPEDFRAGFACIVGRPNAGKSTLTNAMVGAKIAITSGRPQTTRHNVRGVIHKENAQIVLVDTPGLHRPRTLLGKRLNDLVRETLADVDVVVFCIPANEKIGPGDRFITRDLAELRTPVVAVVTKADTVTREALAAQLLAVSELGELGRLSSRSQPSATSRSTSLRRFCWGTCRCPRRCTPPVRSPTSPSRS